VTSGTQEINTTCRVMGGQQPGPLPVADGSGVFGGADQVGEQHRGEDPVEFGLVAEAGEEPFDLADERVDGGDDALVAAGEFHGERARDPVGHIQGGSSAGLRVQDQSGHLDGRQHVPDVGRGPHPVEGVRGGGAGGQPVVGHPPVPELLVVGETGNELSAQLAEKLPFPPAEADLFQPPLPFQFRAAPWVIRCGHHAGGGVVQHQGDGPLRVGSPADIARWP
jgi:hypothetical protein